MISARRLGFIAVVLVGGSPLLGCGAGAYSEQVDKRVAEIVHRDKFFGLSSATPTMFPDSSVQVWMPKPFDPRLVALTKFRAVDGYFVEWSVDAQGQFRRNFQKDFVPDNFREYGPVAAVARAWHPIGYAVDLPPTDMWGGGKNYAERMLRLPIDPAAMVCYRVQLKTAPTSPLYPCYCYFITAPAVLGEAPAAEPPAAENEAPEAKEQKKPAAEIPMGWTTSPPAGPLPAYKSIADAIKEQLKSVDGRPAEWTKEYFERPDLDENGKPVRIFWRVARGHAKRLLDGDANGTPLHDIKKSAEAEPVECEIVAYLYEPSKDAERHYAMIWIVPEPVRSQLDETLRGRVAGTRTGG